MYNWLLITEILAISCIFFTSSKEIPDYLQICHRSNPDLNGCILNSVEYLRPQLLKGIPELGVPSIEPLIIEEPISTKGAGLVVSTKDLIAHGGGNFTIKSLKVDTSHLKFNLVVGFEHLHLSGKYEVDGKIIMIPIKGEGDLTCDVYDVEGVIDMFAALKEKDGITELEFTKMDVDVSVANGRIHLDNLFGGDKLIGETINNAINVNFQFFLKELKPVISQTLNEFIVKSANKICDGLPYDKLLPA